jgi:hypothetical protein
MGSSSVAEFVPSTIGNSNGVQVIALLASNIEVNVRYWNLVITVWGLITSVNVFRANEVIFFNSWKVKCLLNIDQNGILISFYFN